MVAAPALAHDIRTLIGYDDLISRVGPGNEPTGLNIVAGHTEAPNSSGFWIPNENDSHFTGKTFFFESGVSGVSTHATSVGRHIYSNSISVAPDIMEIHSWEANHWLGAGFLNTGGAPPQTAVVDFFNNSWIGDAGGFNNEILRRVDSVVDQQEVLVIGGVGNGSSALTRHDLLLSHAYNVISVGVSDGNHHHGDTLVDVDGPGRMKPEIVAPETATSWATGVMSSCVAALLDTARTWPGLSNNTNADRPEVLKAVLMAGAVHESGWTNNPSTSGATRGVTSTPLDPTFGAGTANINMAHLVHTGLEQDGSTTVPLSGSVMPAGWDYTPISSNSSRYYRFELTESKPSMSVLVTWHRRVASNFSSGSLPNIDVELFGVTGNGTLVSLRGNAGIGIFDSGNIASTSTVDNVEHLFIGNLDPGNYVLAVKRTADALASWNAAVAWLLPPDQSQPAELLTFTRIAGSVISGDVTSLRQSDNIYLRMRSQFGFTSAEPNVLEMELDFQTMVASPTLLAFTFEGRINQSGGRTTLRMRNVNTGLREVVDQFDIGTAEIVHQTTGLDATKYVGTGGGIEARVRQSVMLVFSSAGFDSFTDFTGVNVN